MYVKSAIILAVAASASAFAPAPFGARMDTRVFFEFGQFDDKLWDIEAKKEVYGSWDPATPRSTMNFNPFETFKGNSPDASGIYPGEPRYKDPMRGDVSFAIMMEEKAYLENLAANPKDGDAPGANGCKN
mmetsp:Transcript_22419/g.40442  ORF Transcript_22419/g.40442 Transcript_22419/m.40442 type:complete len:130 (-) Transcript_22419:153-542(-)